MAMEGVQGGSAQQLQSVQTQTDSASEVGKSHTHGSVRQVDAQSIPGLTDPSKVKHISLKTRVINFLNNKWTIINPEVKKTVVGSVDNPDTRDRVSNVIDKHNDGVNKLKDLKQEKQQLESEVKDLQKDKKFMKMVAFAKGKSVENRHFEKGKSVLTEDSDGRLKEMSFPHNQHTVNKIAIDMAIEKFKKGPHLSDYLAKLDRIKDITQERAELKETLRNNGKQIFSDLKSSASQQHKDVKQGLSEIKKSEIGHVRNQFDGKLEDIKTAYKEFKGDVNNKKEVLKGELKDLRAQKAQARNEVAKGVVAKWASWHKKNIGSVASALTPKDISVDTNSIENDRDVIKARLEKNLDAVEKLNNEINSKKKEIGGQSNRMNNFRKARDNKIKDVKDEKVFQKQAEKTDYDMDKRKNDERYDMVKDVAKALKGNSIKDDKKKG